MTARDRVLDAAAELAGEGESITLSAVAKRAGVARSTLYRHFPDLLSLTGALAASGQVVADRLRSLDPTDRILDAVSTLLETQSLATITIDEVARTAGVAPITVYRRFGDRNGLLQAWVVSRTPRRLALVLPDEWGDLERNLTRIAQECMEFLQNQRALFLVAFSSDPESRTLLGEMRGNTGSVRELTRRVLEGRVPGDTVLHAHAFLGLVLALGWDADAASVPSRAALAVSHFLHGALP
jgi:AcrR family transcriptional regulator